MVYVTNTILVVHVAAGFAALLAGTFALTVRKGWRLHRSSGRIFGVTMLVMAVTACILGVILPGQIANLLIGILAIYLVTTGWLTVARPRARAVLADRIALGVSLCLCAPFILIMAHILIGGPPLPGIRVPSHGPILVALCSFTALLLIAALGDIRVVAWGALTGPARLGRHLWRMCLGLTFAAGSGFTNGFARLLPGPYHVPLAFFLPQFIPLILMVFWLIRVRLRFRPRAEPATVPA